MPLSSIASCVDETSRYSVNRSAMDSAPRSVSLDSIAMHASSKQMDFSHFSTNCEALNFRSVSTTSFVQLRVRSLIAINSDIKFLSEMINQATTQRSI